MAQMEKLIWTATFSSSLEVSNYYNSISPCCMEAIGQGSDLEMTLHNAATLNKETKKQVKVVTGRRNIPGFRLLPFFTPAISHQSPLPNPSDAQHPWLREEEHLMVKT